MNLLLIINTLTQEVLNNNSLLSAGPHVCGGDPIALHHEIVGMFTFAFFSTLCEGDNDKVP